MYITNMDINKNLEICISAVTLAGNFLKENKEILNITNSSQGRDIKLVADIESEKLITEYLQANSDYPILGEEAGQSKDLGSIYWVVDPLDGTANFSRNIPISCVSIALVEEKNPIIGAINDFNNNDIFHGSIETKAFMNKNEISTSLVDDKSQATLITGLPVNTDYSNESMKRFIQDFKTWKKIRMLGSAAMAAAYIASGRADVYKESGTNLWDIAAGVAIVRAAGGKAKISNLKDDFSLDIHISNGLLS